MYVDEGVGGVRVEFDCELDRGHGSEDVDFVLALDGLAGGVHEHVFQVGLMIDVLDVEGVVQQGQQEVLLTLVEVVVGFERLQTVDEFLVGVFFGFEVVEVLVIVQDDQVDLFCEVVVNAGYFL